MFATATFNRTSVPVPQGYSTVRRIRRNEIVVGHIIRRNSQEYGVIYHNKIDSIAICVDGMMNVVNVPIDQRTYVRK
jgi:hypothetical protein